MPLVWTVPPERLLRPARFQTLDDASCSNPVDEERIRQSILGHEARNAPRLETGATRRVDSKKDFSGKDTHSAHMGILVGGSTSFTQDAHHSRGLDLACGCLE